MTLVEALPALLEDKRLARKEWEHARYLELGSFLIMNDYRHRFTYALQRVDLEADDWEVLERPSKA